MTNTKALLELAARCEEAEGADRELDKTIHRDVMGFCLHSFDRLEKNGAQSDTGFDCLDCGADSWGNKGRNGEGLHDPIPTYTASLDAALTLVPEGYIAAVINAGCDDPRAPDFTRGCAVVGLPNAEPQDAAPITAATPALALCAASLRAIAQEQDNAS